MMLREALPETPRIAQIHHERQADPFGEQARTFVRHVRRTAADHGFVARAPREHGAELRRRARPAPILDEIHPGKEGTHRCAERAQLPANLLPAERIRSVAPPVGGRAAGACRAPPETLQNFPDRPGAAGGQRLTKRNAEDTRPRREIIEPPVIGRRKRPGIEAEHVEVPAAFPGDPGQLLPAQRPGRLRWREVVADQDQAAHRPTAGPISRSLEKWFHAVQVYDCGLRFATRMMAPTPPLVAWTATCRTGSHAESAIRRAPLPCRYLAAERSSEHHWRQPISWRFTATCGHVKQPAKAPAWCPCAPGFFSLSE